MKPLKTVGVAFYRLYFLLHYAQPTVSKYWMQLVSELEFNVPFQHKCGYIRDKRSGVESYPYPVNEGQQYINLNPGHTNGAPHQ